MAQVDWKAEYAYTTGMQAFIYGFPYVYNAKLRHDWVTQARDPAVIPYAAVGHFWHAARVMDATYRDGGCPNNDTLYSLTWLDLSEEPVILSHPDMASRYFTFELMGFTSDNFDYVGQRTTGSKAGHFGICGPGWHGELPPGVQATRPAPTPWALLLGRTLVDGDADLAAVHALQAQYRLTPLSLWGKPGATVPERRDVYAPAEAAQDPLGPWKTLNAMLAENPPPPHQAVLLRQFAHLGIGPGLDVDAQPEAVKQGLTRAAMTGMGLLSQQFLSAGHEPDPQPGPALFSRRPDPGAEAGPGRRADHLPAARLARPGAGTELAAHLRRAPVVRDLADVPAPARGDRGQVGMPGPHPAHLTTAVSGGTSSFRRRRPPVSQQEKGSMGHETICQAAPR